MARTPGRLAQNPEDFRIDFGRRQCPDARLGEPVRRSIAPPELQSGLGGRASITSHVSSQPSTTGRSYAALMRRLHAPQVGYIADLAYKTRRLVEEGASQEGLGRLTKTVRFDVKTLEGLRDERGSDEGKVFNLVRSLHHELEGEPATAPVLRPIAERADRILQELEQRNITGMAAMDYIAAIAKEKEGALKAAKDSGLSAAPLGGYWSLKDDDVLAKEGISGVELAKEAETLLARFPNARSTMTSSSGSRAALYRPLLGLGKEERSRVVESVLVILLDAGSDANS